MIVKNDIWAFGAFSFGQGCGEMPHRFGVPLTVSITTDNEKKTGAGKRSMVARTLSDKIVRMYGELPSNNLEHKGANRFCKRCSDHFMQNGTVFIANSFEFHCKTDTNCPPERRVYRLST